MTIKWTRRLLGHSLARSLTPLTPSLAPYCSRAMLCSFVCSLAHSLAPELMGKRFLSIKWTRRFHTVSTQSALYNYDLCHLGFSYLAHKLWLMQTSIIWIVPQWNEMRWNRRIHFIDKQPLSHELGSEWMSERCERTSERTSEWPSTLRVDFIVILPNVRSNDIERKKEFETKAKEW